MIEFAWMPHVFSIELRKAISYRAQFWIRFVLQVVTEMTAAYFLWRAIFDNNGAQTLQGYSFHGILFYYLFSSLGSKLIQTLNEGIISREIYTGTLTRYLLYPLPFLAYKFVAELAKRLIAILQLIFCLGLAIWMWSLPADQNISFSSVALGIFTASLAGYVYFMISAALEMVAFWQDTVWNLLAMVRFVGGLLGGLMLPIEFFPTWGRAIIRFTPFPSMLSFPIHCFLGQVGAHEWFLEARTLLVWAIVTTFIAAWVWSRGTRRYSGVGI